MHQHEPIYKKIERVGRIAGIVEPSYGIWLADQALQGVDKLSPVERESAVNTALKLIRGAFLLQPLDPAILTLLEQLSQHGRSSPAFSTLLGRMRRILDIIPKIGIDHADKELNEKAKDPDAALQLCQRTRYPLVSYLAGLRLWQWGCAEHFAKFCESSMSKPEIGLIAPILAWGTYKLASSSNTDSDHFNSLTSSLLKKSLESPFKLNLLARMAADAGDARTATDLYLKSLEIDEHQPHLSFSLQALNMSVPDASILLGNKIAVLFYTFNKLEITLETLNSLLRSDINDAPVFLLNNGSTNFSPTDMDAGVSSAASGRNVKVIHLPTNIGAPAARNWLKSMPEIRDFDYIAYLDDDVLLPEHWLRCYVQTLKNHRNAVAVGPKAVNPDPFGTIQYGARFFQEVSDRHIRFNHHAPIALDFGQLDRVHPCLSVMGCCHLFDLKRWQGLSLPDFDIRFSPSQVDDIEHDIRIWNMGGEVYFDGRVSVVHRQDGGKSSQKSKASWAHVWGNHIKMEYKFSEEELKTIEFASNTAFDRAWNDCQQNLKNTELTMLHSGLPGEVRYLPK